MEENEKMIFEPGVINKAAQVGSLQVDNKEMTKINKLTLEPLKAEDVFAFKVAMCDNEIDRTYEVFPLKSLKKMQKLFIGKTMIKDHFRKADNQVARIYDTELSASETEVTQTGEVYNQLVAHCYMLANDANKQLIDEIKGGIKKEVSVGLKVGRAVCSICGTDNAVKACNHWWGKAYDGQTCHFSLEDPVDAYELSFVAVPAQPNAGTIKQYGPMVKKDEPEMAEPEAVEEDKPEDQADEKQLNIRIKALDAYIYTRKAEGE